jgi:phosphoribosylglycinamide formyltransferase-1
MSTPTDGPLVRVATPDAPLRVAVLASGSGSNLQALLDAHVDRQAAWRVQLVIVNVAGVTAIARAEAAGVVVHTLPHAGMSREAHEARVAAVLDEHDIELVVLAGYMRVLTAAFVARYADRIINVHPALLPAFPGMHGAKQALDYGCRVAGCTVHLVDAGVDTGAVLAQAAVDILDDDDEAALQARIQREEHRLLPAVVSAVAAGRLRREGGRVRGTLPAPHPPNE